MNFYPEFTKAELRPRARDSQSHFRQSAELGSSPSDAAVTAPRPDQVAALAAEINEGRSRRASFFANCPIGESCWEILVFLYRSDFEGQRTTITNLCRASQVPNTTALRRIKELIEAGLVYRRKSSLDSRVFFIELNPSGRQLVYSYLSEVWIALYCDST